MLLALWSGFSSSWGGSISVSVAPIVAIDSLLSNGGKGRPNNTYEMLPEEYWEAREASINRSMPPPEENVTKTTLPPRRTDERAGHLASIKAATNIDELRAASAKLREYDGKT